LVLLLQTENRDRVEIQAEQEQNEVLIDGDRLSEDKAELSEPPNRAINQMRAETGAPLPGFSQSGNPTLVLGSFSVITMPMPRMNEMLQNILPLLQKLPAPTQLLSG
jgi:hypothetical protein